MKVLVAACKFYNWNVLHRPYIMWQMVGEGYNKVINSDWRLKSSAGSGTPLRIFKYHREHGQTFIHLIPKSIWFHGYSAVSGRVNTEGNSSSCINAALTALWLLTGDWSPKIGQVTSKYVKSATEEQEQTIIPLYLNPLYR